MKKKKETFSVQNLSCRAEIKKKKRKRKKKHSVYKIVMK